MSRSAAAVHRVIKAYDVRGLVGEEIDESFVTDVGAAFARLMRGEDARQVVIGYDMRDSSPSLAAAFGAGVTAQGLDVVRIGLASTDQLYFAAGCWTAPARCSPRVTTLRPTTASSYAGREPNRSARTPG
jgi:phosphomannomutase